MGVVVDCPVDVGGLLLLLASDAMVIVSSLLVSRAMGLSLVRATIDADPPTQHNTRGLACSRRLGIQ